MELVYPPMNESRGMCTMRQITHRLGAGLLGPLARGVAHLILCLSESDEELLVHFDVVIGDGFGCHSWCLEIVARTLIDAVIEISLTTIDMCASLILDVRFEWTEGALVELRWGLHDGNLVVMSLHVKYDSLRVPRYKRAERTL